MKTALRRSPRAIAAALATALTAALAATPAAAASGAESEDSGRALCAAIDAMGFSARPCAVSGERRVVSAWLHMTPAQARSLCGSMARLAPVRGWRFAPGWTLQIYGARGGDAPAATCGL